MGIRETLNQNPAITTGATAGLIVVALIYIFWSTFSGGDSTGPVGATKAYFSTDDGASFVADDADNLYRTFQIGGKPAVIAHVYSCDGKTRFVGWLERYTPEGQKALQAQTEALKQGKIPNGNNLAVTGREVKRPKEARWVGVASPDAAAITRVKCPDGKGDAVEVMPE